MQGYVGFLDCMDVSGQLFILLKIFIAAILAGAVGFERELRKKPAGLRTHMIVGAGSCLLVSLSALTVNFFQMRAEKIIETDPIRTIQAIIIGLGFMGAGTILKKQSTNEIKYLTTAASFFISSGIGIGVAIEQYVLCVGVALLFVILNPVLYKVENFIKNEKRSEE